MTRWKIAAWRSGRLFVERAHGPWVDALPPARPVKDSADFSEKLLLRLSRSPETEDCAGGQPEWTLENALDKLRAMYPGFLERIQGKEILDHGSGLGFQSAALAMRGAKHVVGIDPRAAHLRLAQGQIRQLGLEDRVEFRDRLSPELDGRFDLVISQNSMEHYPDPAGCLAEMVRALKPGGKILLTFGPPWHAPHGSHMHFFTRVPWVNLLFSEKTVMNVRRHFRDDGARRYEEVEGGLNRMTVKKFDRLLAEACLRVLYRRNDGVKGLDFLPRLPVLRELFTNNIACELAKE